MEKSSIYGNLVVIKDEPSIMQRTHIESELRQNILPFWIEHIVDHDKGGFHGAMTNDLQVVEGAPRASITCARILWTYSAAYRKYGDVDYLQMAQRAYQTLSTTFWDQEFGGVYWWVDENGRPVDDRKVHYAQAFAIYGLSEYYRVTQDQNQLGLSQQIFNLLEEHAYDPLYGGYIEASRRDWGELPDMRLSPRDMDCRKSMNTLLHILEAYTNLLRLWPQDQLAAQQKALIEVMLNQVMDKGQKHFRLYFENDWRSLSPDFSFGHDIEGSWLLVEAAEVCGDAELLDNAKKAAVHMAAAVLEGGVDDDGGLFYEGGPEGIVDEHKEWWVQAEAMVGFYNAYQISGGEEFAQAASRCWEYIQEKLVDREHGEWFKRLSRTGEPDPKSYKAGPWEDPYHQSRACMQMLERLPG